MSKGFSQFYPDYYIRSVYQVDFARLRERGFAGAAFDIDNTLVKHDVPADAAAAALFRQIRESGLKTCLISNNHELRVKAFADAVGADAYIFDAHKPDSAGYRQAAERLGIEQQEMIFFGDQLFTDIWGAKNAGVASVLVKPVGPEKYFHIVMKRCLEKPILLTYRRKHPEYDIL